MYPEIFYSNTFTLLAEAEVGKHFYWNIARMPTIQFIRIGM
jgi:hypothetical protein